MLDRFEEAVKSSICLRTFKGGNRNGHGVGSMKTHQYCDVESGVMLSYAPSSYTNVNFRKSVTMENDGNWKNISCRAENISCPDLWTPLGSRGSLVREKTEPMQP